MPVRNLDRIFKPQRVAVIGASDREASVGYSVLHNLISTGFGGVVYPVNNKREAVQGIQAYPSVSELPHCPDLAIIATPAATVPGLVTECGRAGVGGVIILSAGFGEVGREGKTLQSSLKQAAAEFPKLRIIGPNCLGIIAPHRRLNASFAATPAEPGNVAFISQSGALCTSILEWAEREKIGFSAFGVDREHDRRERGGSDRLLLRGSAYDVGDSVSGVDHRKRGRFCRRRGRSRGASRLSRTSRGVLRSRQRQRRRTPGHWPAKTRCTTRRFSGRESCGPRTWTSCSTPQSCWHGTHHREEADWRS